ncbi:MAG: LEA type 2 family protein [Bacteroidota bacterium]|nr:LEA type 2 family protein [Bacteroidota bacterium]MDP3146757.1 LEA type 2 family protein [Bacteroidota bacterium]MDP3557144.1 LEA type 2 family protein [Bacteroidota bacterium]
MRVLNLIITVIFFFVFLGCKDFKEAQCTGVKGFKINKISAQGIDADIILGIKNPNHMGFSIYRSEFDVVYSGINLGKAKLTKRVYINGDTEKNYSFNLKSNFKDANPMDVMKLMSGGAKSVIEVTGDLKAGKFYLKKRFPVKVKQKVDMNSRD